MEHTDVEILVHIQAPSRAADDARYRSLATAYLAFEPILSARVLEQSEDGGGSSKSGLVDGRWPTSQLFAPLKADKGESYIMLSDERLGSFSSIQASFESVIDNSHSPQLHMRQQHIGGHASLPQIPISATQASWETPPSIVQDSYPMNHTSFASLNSPTRVLENYLQHFDSPSGLSHHDSQINSVVVPHEAEAKEREGQLQAREIAPYTGQNIPCTLGFAEQSKQKGKGSQLLLRQQQLDPESKELSDDDLVIEETTILPSQKPLIKGREDAEPPPKRRQLNSSASVSGALARATSDIGPRSLSTNKVPVTVTFLTTHGFTYESLEIRPPEPAASDLPMAPDKLVTPGLDRLGRDVDIALRFRPREQKRELRPYERGYWLVDCSSWEPWRKRASWAFLANYIGMGKAGWGVWCKRDSEFTELRVYCWGSVVAHMYYVLWLSSQREIKFTGSSWVDGQGLSVITMGPGNQTQT